jgi:hypothetical protein
LAEQRKVSSCGSCLSIKTKVRNTQVVFGVSRQAGAIEAGSSQGDRLQIRTLRSG